MDKLIAYRQIIDRVLSEYAKLTPAYGEIQAQTVFDQVGDHFLLMHLGWDCGRVHGCLVHIDLIGGKCWIQRDGTERGIALELEAAGIPKSDIVLAFKAPELRPHTGYAVA
ncbi:MAG: fdxN element excision controlling factor protein [Phycisphaerales bacterium]|jgi:hypothetical protein|nr:fdxN element excision controlling factor protein [Phycisphaerales bacterium]